MKTLTLLFSTVGCIAVIAAYTQQPPAPTQAPQAPVFRSGTTVVPIDVRVLDRHGKPITDLERKDFTVREDGVAQDIAHFAATAMTPSVPFLGPRKPGQVQPPKGDGPSFHVLRGNGYLSSMNPFNSLDGTSGFVSDIRAPNGQLVTQIGLDAPSGREPLQAGTAPQLAGPARAAGQSVGLARFGLDPIGVNTIESNDVIDRLTKAIDDLKHDEGEKHIVLSTKAPPTFTRGEDVDRLARAAADARVVIDVAQDGACGCWGAVDLERLARLTGGVAGIYSSPDKVHQRISTVNSFGYQLGYYPSDTTLDSRYRRITVTVNRPGAELMYRDGYYARKPALVMDPPTRKTYNRMTDALRSAQPITELQVSATAALTGRDKERAVDVQIHVAPDGITLTETAGMFAGTIQVAVFCGTSRDAVVGRAWDAIDLKLTPEQHARFVADGLSFSKQVPVTGAASSAKVVVYDAGSDRAGSTMVAVVRK